MIPGSQRSPRKPSFPKSRRFDLTRMRTSQEQLPVMGTRGGRVMFNTPDPALCRDRPGPSSIAHHLVFLLPHGHRLLIKVLSGPRTAHPLHTRMVS